MAGSVQLLREKPPDILMVISNLDIFLLIPILCWNTGLYLHAIWESTNAPKIPDLEKQLDKETIILVKNVEKPKKNWKEN